MADNQQSPFVKHLPIMALGLVVATIFLIAIFTFQVRATEKAVVTRLGKITGIRDAGLHFRLPYPIEAVNTYDIRLRTFDGNVGKLEETFTRDGKNLIVGIYIIYKIDDLKKFYQNVITVPVAENRLNSLMRTVKNAVIGKHDFDQIVNTDPKKMELAKIEQEMLDAVASDAEKLFGVKVVSLGIKKIGVPEKISEKVFERMINERKKVAQKYRSEGERIANQIKAEADKQRKDKITDAEAQAKLIRADGDAQAAGFYATFKKDPELAAFLRKLDALKKIMQTKTTLILDTESVPFDLLKMKPEDISNTQNKGK